VFKNRVLRRIFELKGDEVMGWWRKLHNEELCDVYSLPSIVRMIWGGVDWIGLAEDKEKWRALVNAVMNLWVP
jgi:hypothetical protein